MGQGDGRPLNTSALLKYDWSLFITMMALVSLGLVMIFSSSAISAYQLVSSISYFFQRQIVWSLVGMGVCFTAMTVSFDTIKKLTPLFYVVVAVLLVAVLVPFIGREAGGARRWIDLGIVGFQPSSLAKVALILTTSLYLTSGERKEQNVVRDITVVGGLTLLYAILVALEPDVGTAFQMFLIGMTMLFLAGFPYHYILFSFVLAMPLGALTVFTSGYRRDRVIAYLDPWGDPLDKGYHAIQSMKALGAGGLTGRGLGESLQKMGYLPEPYTDTIVAVMGEELGFLGVLFLIGLIGYLVVKGITVSLRVTDPFQRLVGVGLSALIAMQAAINLSVVSGLIPTTGVSMPFISYGGSSLVLNMGIVGLLMNISREADS
jgi:cell division protein FtsW